MPSPFPGMDPFLETQKWEDFHATFNATLREFLAKRQITLHSPTLHSPTYLVELDLLRGSERLPMSELLPLGDHYAIVSRAKRRPVADVHAWPLLHSLPTLLIPLKDPDVPLELQDVFNTVYDRARDHLTLRYDEPLDPLLDEPTLQWLEQQQS